MQKPYLLIIPLAIGILVGGFLTLYPETEKVSTAFTVSKLIENECIPKGFDSSDTYRTSKF